MQCLCSQGHSTRRLNHAGSALGVKTTLLKRSLPFARRAPPRMQVQPVTRSRFKIWYLGAFGSFSAMPLFVFPAKAGTQFCHGHRPSPV
jgi:hypothetical protein